MPTRPTMGILTPRKVTIQHQLVFPSNSSDDDLSQVKHDARHNVGRRDDPLHLGACSRVGLASAESTTLHSIRVAVGLRCDRVLIPNPEYKGKGRTESASSNPTPRVQRRCPPPKIHGLPGTMEFTDDNMEEEKEELPDELTASLKQKITSLEEQVTEFHLAVYDQQDDFGMLRKATTSKLKCFVKALGDSSLYNAPSP
jgi:hypothetical protein